MANVYIAPVRGEREAFAIELHNRLGTAIENADVCQVDMLMQELKAVSEQERGVVITEAQWKRLLSEARHVRPNFRADCVLSGDDISVLMKAIPADGEAALRNILTCTCVVMLPFPEDIIEINDCK